MKHAAAVERVSGVWPAAVRSIAGGQVGDVCLVEFADRERVVAKIDEAATGQLETEGAMLRYLAETLPDLPFPEPLHVSSEILLMQWLPGSTGCRPQAEVDLAELVARLHAVASPGMGGAGCGFAFDTVVGPVPQPNRWRRDWLGFFGEQRLVHTARLCLDAGRLDGRTVRRIEEIASRLGTWIDGPERPGLLHGDLWSGNVLSTGSRITGLIDPALYFGDPEVELAFVVLFRTVGERFFQTYRALRGIPRADLESFMDERRHLYALHPLLVHAYIYGAQYVDDVRAVAERFA